MRLLQSGRGKKWPTAPIFEEEGIQTRTKGKARRVRDDLFKSLISRRERGRRTADIPARKAVAKKKKDGQKESLNEAERKERACHVLELGEKKEHCIRMSRREGLS